MKISRKIVAIGGCDIRKSISPIDKKIIRLSGKKHPKVLFIPTASSDSEKYWYYFDKYYGKKLHCKTDALLLLKEKLTKSEIEKKIFASDIIYVGGGNTLKMMKLWRRLGVDKMLNKAWNKGIVMCGVSAGSICWFDSGHSDSMSFYNKKKWKYINVKGLGFVKGVHCPHFNSHTLGKFRKDDFKKMMGKIGGIGIGIDNNCAIEFVEDKFRVITSKPYAKAYKVFRKKGKIILESLIQRKWLEVNFMLT